MYAYLLFSIKNPAYLPNIRSFIATASSLLLPGYSSSPTVVQPSEKFLLCYWHTAYAPLVREVNPGHMSGEKGTFLCSNYAGRGLLTLTGGIKHISRIDGGRLAFDRSPGGVASWAWIAPDADTAMAWSTIPPAITTFIAKNRDGFCVAGNRPRLTHAASILSKGYRPSLDYLPKYLTSGFALDGQTSYANTIAIPSGNSATLRDGGYRITEHPTPKIDPIPQDRPLDEKAEALAALLREACWPATRTQAGIFMSGGKDSRTMTAALLGEGVKNALAFNFGNDTTGEGQIAREVSSAAGYGFEFRPQPIVTDPLNGLALALQNSDGLGSGFAHQYNYRYDLAFASGRSSFHGHGHLLRGGSARTMKRDPAFMAAANRSWIVSAYVTETASESTERAFAAYMRDRFPSLAKEPLDALFYPNRDYRLGLFSATSSLDLTAQTLMCYPLLDERVAQFAGALHAFDRISERVVFGAIKKLAPLLANIPLFGEIWRFDRDPDRTDFPDSDHNFQDGQEARKPRQADKFTNLTAPQNSLLLDADQVGAARRKRESAQFILDSSVWRDIMPSITPDIHAELWLRALGRPSDHSSKHPNERFAINQFMDRVAVAAAIYEVRW